MDTESSKFKIRLGMFVAAGIVLFLAAVFLIGRQKNLFNPVFQIKSTFYSVSGLQVGNNVRFSGINIGTVELIKIINDSTVQVDMIIQKDVQPFIKVDCEVSIGSEGIIGDRVIIISQGSSNSPSIKGGQFLLSVEAVELDDILTSLHVSAINAEVISAQLAEIMININQGNGTLGMFIHDTTIAKNINRTILNLRKTSKGLDDNMELIMTDLKETTKDLENNMTSIMKGFNKTTDNITHASVQLSETITNINHGEGTIGVLINDTILAENIRQTIFYLNKSSIGLNQNMKALKSNFLFRGYFKRKVKEAEKFKRDSIEIINAVSEK